MQPYGSDEFGHEHASYSPPTAAGAIPPPASTWPVVFGVIGIVFSAWGIFTSGCGILAVAGLGALGGFGQLSQIQGANNLTGVAMVIAAAKLACIMALSIYLLIASIGLLKRQRSSVTQMVRWSWARMGVALVFLAAEFLTGGISQKTQNATGLAQSAVTAAVIGGVLIGLLLVMWFPVLNIFWFRRPAIRAEVSQWN